jgi:hypothetical protein
MYTILARVQVKSEHWWADCADCMIREGRNMFFYCNEHGLGLTSAECDKVTRSQVFQELFRIRRNIYYKELANDSSLTRTAVKGQLVLAIQKMIEKEQYDKAANAIMQLAKLEGWTSDGTNVNVFNDVTQKDLDALRKRVAGMQPSKENVN